MQRSHRSSRKFGAAAVAVALAALMAGCGRAEPPAPQVSDADVNEHVKTALLRSDALQHADIAVMTTKGDVRLTGALVSQAQVDEALRIARAAEGVHSIHNELTVKN